MLLGVNVDHVATLRQARLAKEPDPVMAATLAILGGADGITVHLREDRRHIQDRDLRLLREIVTVELNLEMAATQEMLRIAIETKPDLVTIVPEKRQELTTEGGLNVKDNRNALKEFIKKINEHGIPVSLFINPSTEDVDISKEIGSQMVEIHTGIYADASFRNKPEELRKILNAVQRARSVGLEVNAGHGLNYHNVKSVAQIPGLRGLYIGHSIVARAVLVGMKEAVREMKTLIESATK
ncbi:MAG: pyridoxine 5'-phosphate synthase [Thermodesulfovibrionales bacterium]|nr:pyridoxine 5'-phosphate synthase [Thermodesulfovibrionales bacterium]